MNVDNILTPQVAVLLVLSGSVTNALVIGVVAWGLYKLAPAVSGIPSSIDTLRVALMTRLEALENKVEDIDKRLEIRDVKSLVATNRN